MTHTTQQPSTFLFLSSYHILFLVPSNSQFFSAVVTINMRKSREEVEEGLKEEEAEKEGGDVE
jgi:hypothetical protein